MSASVLVVGSSEPVAAIAAALTDCGVTAAALRLGSAAPTSESLASALVELERAVTEHGAEAIVALGPGDAATAAALVAGKAGIHLYTLLDPSVTAGGEDRGVAVLSDECLAFPENGPGIVRAAREIAAGLAGQDD